MKDRFTDVVAWFGAGSALLMVLYFLASPVIFTNASQGPTASPLLYKLYGPVLRVLESDFKGPVLWYFGLWGIGIEYFAVEPAPKPPWYVGPVYASIAGGTVVALMCPLLRSRLKRWRRERRTTAYTGLLDDTQVAFRKPSARE